MASIDGGSDVHDVGVAEDVHVAGDFHGADLADASEVIAPKVDKHVVLGDFFLIGEELFFQLPVFCLGLSSRAGTGKREGIEGAVFEFGKGLGRGTGDFYIVAYEVEHIGRGVQDAERAVDVEEAAGRFGSQGI